MKQGAEFAVIVYDELTPAVLVIEDLDLGSMSVTNDIENVIRKCSKSVDLTKKRVIYKDSTGIYDEVLVYNGAFSGFRSLGGITVLELALDAVRSQ